MEIVRLFSEIQKLAERGGSLYAGNYRDRMRLLRFLESNSWFGQSKDVLGRKNIEGKQWDIELYKDAFVVIEKKSSLWLRAYGLCNRERYVLLAEFGEKKFPHTVKKYREFIRSRGLEDDVKTWQLLDFMIGILEKELPQMRRAEVDRIMDAADSELPLSVARMLADFHGHLVADGVMKGWVYDFHQRSKRMTNGAYPADVFMELSYYVFNELHWDKEDMVSKAVSDPEFANTWVYTAMHFVCGWRSGDICRIPMPHLEGGGEEIREKLVNTGVLGADIYARDVEMQIKTKDRKPHKTRNISYVSPLSLKIQQTLRDPVGFIIALAASHCEGKKPGNRFIHVPKDAGIFRSFFGAGFSKALKGKPFLSRRANKSYLQGLEAVADGKPGAAPKGYIIASLARSHKGGIDTLALATSNYLCDSTFTGYSAEFIAREMFERGVFGFIPHILLQIYDADRYGHIGIGAQTKMIQSLGISAADIETLARMSAFLLKKAESTVSEAVSGRKGIAAVLQNISTGAAFSKTDGIYCLMTACGRACPFPERSSCLSCVYEIYTKSILQHMSGEYARLISKSAGHDGWRYKRIALKVVYPMISEFILTVCGMYSGMVDMDGINTILRGGLEGYGSVKPAEWSFVEQSSGDQ